MHMYVQLNNWKSKYKAAGKARWANSFIIKDRSGQRKLDKALKRVMFKICAELNQNKYFMPRCSKQMNKQTRKKKEKSMCLNSRHKFFQESESDWKRPTRSWSPTFNQIPRKYRIKGC